MHQGLTSRNDVAKVIDMNELTKWYIESITALADTLHGDRALELLRDEYQRVLAADTVPEPLFDVVFREPSGKKIATIKVLRKHLGLTIKDAKKIIYDGLTADHPQVILKGVPKTRANDVVTDLRSVGCDAGVIPAGSFSGDKPGEDSDEKLYDVWLEDLPRMDEDILNAVMLAVTAFELPSTSLRDSIPVSICDDERPVKILSGATWEHGSQLFDAITAIGGTAYVNFSDGNPAG